MKMCSKDLILITGASSGIGYACAQQAIKQGARRLLLTARDEAKLIAAQQELSGLADNCDVRVFVCDQSDGDQVEQLARTLLDSELLPNKIIANVGINPVHQIGPKKAASTSGELLLNTLNINLINMHRLLAVLLKPLQRTGASIVLVGSQAYQLGIKGQLAYNVSKAALVGYKNTLVSEYGGRQVFCHLLNPGLVANQRTENLRKQVGSEHCVTEEQVASAICELLAEQVNNGLEINV